MANPLRFSRLEAARGAACLYVVFVHAVGALPERSAILRIATAFGQEAVMVFFVLSGFVIGWSSTREGVTRDAWGTYFAKRFVRIYSVWVPSVIAKMAIDGVEQGSLVVDPPGRWVGNALMLQDMGALKPAVICEPLQNSGALWSLNYEWWFYMTLPLVCCVRGTNRQLHAVGLMAIMNAVVYSLLPNPLSRFAMYLIIWWVGVHAAAVFRARNAIHLKDVAVPLCYCVASAIPGCVVAAVTWAGGRPIAAGVHPLLESRHLLAPVVLVPLVFAWRSFRWLGFRTLLGWCIAVSPISYSLYIMHGRGFISASYLAAIGNPLIEQVLYVLITLSFCWAVEVLLFPSIRSRAGL